MSSEGESGSKRAAPESVVSSCTNATPSSIGEIAPPSKKQATAETVTSSSAPIIKAEAASSSSDTGILDTAEGPIDELLLEWSTWDSNTDECIDSCIPVDEILGIPFAETKAVKENEKGENHERGYRLKLVDKKEGSKNKELAHLSFQWWEESARANLMNFNQLSEDLADFSSKLWGAAGRNENEYSDMAIEFGESRHSGVEVNDLLVEAYDYSEVNEIAYITSCKKMTKAQGLRLLNGLIAFAGPTSNLIAHVTDLDKMQVRSEARDTLEFEPLNEGQGNEWHVRAGCDND
mmetsp:Transcript_22258/g.40123  ORF Transcript_22258/g.40123 Transcript_22258/m.40123 type:complete len:292 (-) Transcript_22258:294-1169(-)|eukprot:CAMPEP_0198295530 /NCGR_PEP_ID=MMETSP1449-20131203/28145_1 /TAXON_ID=420275 /ORGANISM="Attheya septentrionalis, Strain CCMP2084" /LENGTH=291 /DNA_ID=CAMNT_0043995871 /DNA_START=70 /DNA_END=945 /DNA_ORIENTATION=+